MPHATQQVHSSFYPHRSLVQSVSNRKGFERLQWCNRHLLEAVENNGEREHHDMKHC